MSSADGAEKVSDASWATEINAKTALMIGPQANEIPSAFIRPILPLRKSVDIDRLRGEFHTLRKNSQHATFGPDFASIALLQAI
jgi:hypothetical protein